MSERVSESVSEWVSGCVSVSVYITIHVALVHDTTSYKIGRSACVSKFQGGKYALYVTQAKQIIFLLAALPSYL